MTTEMDKYTDEVNELIGLIQANHANIYMAATVFHLALNDGIKSNARLAAETFVDVMRK